MILMQHQFDYILKGIHKKKYVTMVCIGKDDRHTAMSLTVGLPLAMTARKIMEGSFVKKGVLCPIYPELYNPVLEELARSNIKFIEEEAIMS
jgi:saccharopine dehydrogenase (NAD+, L-glutamate forming)